LNESNESILTSTRIRWFESTRRRHHCHFSHMISWISQSKSDYGRRVLSPIRFPNLRCLFVSLAERQSFSDVCRLDRPCWGLPVASSLFCQMFRSFSVKPLRQGLANGLLRRITGLFSSLRQGQDWDGHRMASHHISAKFLSGQDTGKKLRFGCCRISCKTVMEGRLFHFLTISGG
jgi:hypothetical protein